MAAATKAPFALVVFAATLLALARSANAECPWSPEDASDNAKIMAHQACKQDELLAAELRMIDARTAVRARVKEVLSFFAKQEDQLAVLTSHANWERASMACPMLSNSLEATPEHLTCLEQDYRARAKFLDEMIAQCRVGICDLSKL